VQKAYLDDERGRYLERGGEAVAHANVGGAELLAIRRDAGTGDTP
jgi:hypothetical protein